MDPFHLPMFDDAYVELQNFQQLISQHMQIEDPYVWSYPWVGFFFVAKAYAHLKNTHHQPPAFGWLWNSCYQQKHNSCSKID
jgi:hypothetical protein